MDVCLCVCQLPTARLTLENTAGSQDTHQHLERPLLRGRVEICFPLGNEQPRHLGVGQVGAYERRKWSHREPLPVRRCPPKGARRPMETSSSAPLCASETPAPPQVCCYFLKQFSFPNGETWDGPLNRTCPTWAVELLYSQNPKLAAGTSHLPPTPLAFHLSMQVTEEKGKGSRRSELPRQYWWSHEAVGKRIF